MLDPLSALSLASCVIQIVDFGCKLVSETQEIYHSASGATKENVTSGEIAKDINLLYKDLTSKEKGFQRLGPDEKALGKLVDSCAREAEALIKLLAELEVPQDANQWKSFQIAIKSARKRGKVHDIESRLLKIQKQINARLLVMMKYVPVDLFDSTDIFPRPSNQQSALSLRMDEISKEHTRMQLESVHHMEQIKADIRTYAASQTDESSRAQILAQKLENLVRESHRVAKEERILKSLEFDEWKRRFTDVHKAHKQTFDWMLEDSRDPAVPPTGFKDWLRDKNNIYWISGKAGSGKSTLMKHLVEERSVGQYLQEWAGPSARLVLISWFFWAAGSPVQRSKEGLFQSLLFQILRRCPDLIPIVCESRWQEDSVYGKQSDPWTLEELDDAFHRIANQPMPGMRFCMFIDGLDEYDGLPTEIIDRLQLLAKAEGIKMCLASRPWTPFRTAFAEGNCDGFLLLERHTKPDIERFVKDILEKDKRFTLAERRDQRYGLFVHEVIERALGVFLWVYLVVKDLLLGLGERNKLEDLRAKLDAMPDDLESYFRRIFDRVDKAHRTESAKVFLMTIHAIQPLSIACYHYLEKEHREPRYALERAIEPMSTERLELIHEDVRDRINFLCKDLLEVNEVLTDQRLDYQVDFLHRTVRDFLMEKDMHQDLVRRATENNTTEWNAHQALRYVELARAKSLSLKDGIRMQLNVLFSLVDALMFYIHEVEVEQKVPQKRLLEQLDQVILDYADNDMAYHWTNARDQPKGLYFDECNHNNFLALAVQCRLVLYVQEKLSNKPNLLRGKRGRPLLDYALRPNLVTPTKLPQLVEFIDFDMVRLLLDRGADPNEKVSIYGNITVWALFLLSCYENKDIQNHQVKDTWFKAAELMIRKGADRKLKLETTRRERFGKDSDQESMLLKTAKYERRVVRGGAIEVDVPVELTAVDIVKEVFGDGKIAEIEAIVPERQNWSVWNLFGWT